MGRATRAAITAALSVFSVSVRAQTPAQEPWVFKITPYAWFAGITGDVGVGSLQTSASLSPSDILDHLRWVTTINGEARKGSWLLFGDVIYVSLGAERVIAIKGDTGQFNLRTHEWVVQPMGGYTLGDETYGVDLMVGTRFFHINPVLDVASTNRPPNRREITRGWLDPVAGLRARATIPSSRFRLMAYGDEGGGRWYSNAHTTWQAYGQIGYDVAFNWMLAGGARVLAVDYNHDNLLVHTYQRGAYFAATFTFK
jgi:hypothetical protein